MKAHAWIRAAAALALVFLASAEAAEVTLYLQPNYGGRQVTLRGHTPSLGNIGFQDQVSSMVVHSGRWEVCTQPDFKGDCVTVGPGEYPALDQRLNHRIESAREVGSYREQTGAYGAYGRGSLELFGQPGFRGRSLKLDQDAASLESSGFNNRASSVIVSEGTWQLCSDPGYGGTCRTFAPGEYPDLGYGMAKEVSSARVVRAHREAPAVLGGGFDTAAPGTGRVILFNQENLRGDSLAVSSANPGLGRSGFDNSAASLVIEGTPWLLCTEPFFRGDCRVLAPGRYANLRVVALDRNISSLRPTGATERGPAPAPTPKGDIELYSEQGYGGASFATRRDVSNLGPTNFNDKAQSAVVYSGQWELCTDGEYGGSCAVFGPGSYPSLGGLSSRLSSLRRIR
jgi:hypothetical protein